MITNNCTENKSCKQLRETNDNKTQNINQKQLYWISNAINDNIKCIKTKVKLVENAKQIVDTSTETIKHFTQKIQYINQHQKHHVKQKLN